MADRKDGDYDVGYGKPPVATRWRPGQSGNPKGRAKGARGLKTDLAAALDRRQTIPTKSGDLTDRRQFLMVETLTARAALGDLRAQKLLLPLLVQLLGVEDRGQQRRSLSAADQALLDSLLADGVGPAEPPADLPGPNVTEDGDGDPE